MGFNSAFKWLNVNNRSNNKVFQDYFCEQVHPYLCTEINSSIEKDGTLRANEHAEEK